MLLRAFTSLRWVGLVPMMLTVWTRRETLDRAWLAVLALVAAVAFTTWVGASLRTHPTRLMSRTVCYLDLALAAALLIADGWVFGWEHTFTPPAIGALWALASVMTAGLVLGPLWGAVAGGAVALSRLVGLTAPEVEHGPPSISSILEVEGPRLIPAVSLVSLYCVAGLGAGYLARLQQRAEDTIGSAKAREEVARTLHDGVLQTLAIVQRRTRDPLLARLARDTDRDLRAFLAGTVEARPGSLGDALRSTCLEFGHRFDISAELMLDDIPEHLDMSIVQAIRGAVAEALANVGKHARATQVIVYAGAAEAVGGLLITVNDNGVGFNPESIRSDHGIARSIRDRIEGLGGTVKVRSAATQGTEVQLWIP